MKKPANKANKAYKGNKLRAPAVPLITVDPYFSVWSMADKLHYENTRHWTGALHGMAGMARIDGRTYRFMGRIGGVAPMEQTGLEITPLRTIYTFMAAGVGLKVTFMTPLLPDDLDVLSRPVSYITFDAAPVDGKKHDVKIYFDAAGELCVNSREQEITWGSERLDDGSTAMHMGTADQPVLGKSGDDLRIDWGYAYIAVPSGTRAKTCIAPETVRAAFAAGAELPDGDDVEKPRPAGKNPPVMAACIDFGNTEEMTAFIIIAYDDIYAVEYFCKPLKGYWAKNGKSIGQAITEAISDYDMITEKCRRFDSKLLLEARRSGGGKYADILALVYRQAVAAHKLVADENGDVLFFSKECFSNGCMATVDVSYPSVPLFLLYNPELVKGMLRPVFKFARMPVWKYDFAPHDAGRYPHANGQVYALKQRPLPNTRVMPAVCSLSASDEPFSDDRQMPVEECGNMLIMTAAVCIAEKNPAFAEENIDLLGKWVGYLTKYGQDPGNQLCTDDFAGHLAHNVNLSAKAIMGITAYGMILDMIAAGKPGQDGVAGNSSKGKEGAAYIKMAKKMAAAWEKEADDGDHCKLTFDRPGSWSMKYNLVWDVLFGTGIFSKEIIGREIRYYKKAANDYGLPLDSRDEYTKSDWLLWCAAMAEEKDDFDTLVDPLWKFLNETPCRVPFTDWYETVSGYQTHCRCHEGRNGFRNRTVQGGLFIKLLKDRGILSAASC